MPVRIIPPPATGRPGLLVEHNAFRHPLAASAIKTLLLCEALRQADSPTVTDTIAARQVALDETVRTFDRPSLQPPYLSGQVPEHTKLEAAITHSDYTSTDMAAPESALIRGGLC